MDKPLYILKTIINADHLYLKIKVSREEIEDKHPHRLDLIKSMKESEVIALESCEFMRLAREELSVYSKLLSASHLANLKLEAEIIELRKINSSLLTKVNL